MHHSAASAGYLAQIGFLAALMGWSIGACLFYFPLAHATLPCEEAVLFLAQQGSHQGLVETIFSHKMELLPEMDDLTSFDFRT